jgi:hypothetical protein
MRYFRQQWFYLRGGLIHSGSCVVGRLRTAKGIVDSVVGVVGIKAA